MDVVPPVEHIVGMILISSFFFVITHIQWYELIFYYSRIGLLVPILYIGLYCCGFVAFVREVRSARRSARHGVESTGRSKVEKLQFLSLASFLAGFVFGDAFYLVWEFSCWQDFVQYHCRMDRVALVDVYMILRIIYMGCNFLYVDWTSRQLRNRAASTVHYQLVHVTICVVIIIDMFLYDNRDSFLGDESTVFKLCTYKNDTVPLINNTCVTASDRLAKASNFLGVATRPMGMEYLFLAITIMIRQWISIRGSQATYAMRLLSSSVGEGRRGRWSYSDDRPASRPERSLSQRSEGSSTESQDDGTNSADRASGDNSLRWRYVLFGVAFLAIVSLAVALGAWIGNDDSNTKLFLATIVCLTLVAIVELVILSDLIRILLAAHEENYTQARVDTPFVSILVSSAGVYLRCLAIGFAAFLNLVVGGSFEKLSSFDLAALFFDQVVQIIGTSMVTVAIFLIRQDSKLRLYRRSERMKSYLWSLCMAYVLLFLYRSTIEAHKLPWEHLYIKFYGEGWWKLFTGMTMPFVLYNHFNAAYIMLEYMIADDEVESD